MNFGIQSGEDVQRALWLDAGDSRYLIEFLPGQVALFEQAAAGQDEIVNALISAERHLNGMLRRHIGAQPHIGQQADALDETGCVLGRSGDHQPAGSVTGHPVGLGQPIEGQAQQVGSHGRHGDVDDVVVEDLVVDLISEQQQLVFARQIGDLAERLPAVDRAGRVIRVDHHQRLGARRDLRFDIGDIGLPTVGLVAKVVHRCTAGQRRRRRPQRIVRCRDQNLIAVVQ